MKPMTHSSVIVLSGGYQIQRKQFQGRPHLVAPVILLTEGVHAGSGGPLLYPASELAKFPASWNGIPIPVLHPADADGNPISCNHPDVLDNNSIGRLFNVTFGDGKLKGEIWVDEAKTKANAPQVYAALLAGNEIEISTGLFSDDDPVSGEWKGEHFNSIARNMRPDHLALLPGQRGACSVADGCGVRANEKGKEGEGMEANVAKRSDVSPGEGESKYGNVTFADAKNKKYPIDTEAHIRAAWNYINKGKNAAKYSPADAKAIKSKIIAAWKKKIDPAGPPSATNNEEVVTDGIDLPVLTGLAEVIFNDMSHNETMSAVSKMCDSMDQRTSDGKPIALHYPLDVFDNFFVYSKETNDGRKLYRQDYTIDTNDAIVPNGEPKEVKKSVSYVPVATTNNQNQEKEDSTMAEKKVCCPEKVKALVASDQNPFTVEDEAWLKELSEEQFAAIEKKTFVVANKEPEKKEEKKEEAMKANSADEFIANAPAEYKEMLTSGLKLHRTRKEQLVKNLMANALNPYTEDELKGKSVDELEKIAQIARVPDFSGRGGVDANKAADDNKGAGPVLELPVLNIEAKK